MDAYFIFKRKYQSELVFWTFAFYGYFVLITLFKNSGEVLNATMRLFNAVSFVIIVEYIFNKFEIKKNRINFYEINGNIQLFKSFVYDYISSWYV